MNFRDYFNKINETPVFNDQSKDLGKKSLQAKDKDETRYESTKKNGHLIDTKKYDEYILEMWKISQPGVKQIRIFALLNQEIVGFLGIAYRSFLPLPQVSASYVYDDYQGQGIGKAMYKMAIDNIGGLISDDSLTGERGHGSFQMWQSLAKIYPAYVLKWDNDSRRIKTYKVPKFTEDMMGDGRDEWFCVSKNERSLD